jgi:Pyruvate kinase, alpha/beta domain/Pyruvate kinase, barrel domain
MGVFPSCIPLTECQANLSTVHERVRQDDACSAPLFVAKLKGMRNACMVVIAVVLCRCDAVMLSGETANGAFPSEAVATMAAIAANSECAVDHRRRYNFLRSWTPKPMDSAAAVASSAVQLSLDLGAKAILCFTSSGRAPLLLSRYRPEAPVFVLTPDESKARQCRLQYGLRGVVMSHEGLQVRGTWWLTQEPPVSTCPKAILLTLTDGTSGVLTHASRVYVACILIADPTARHKQDPVQCSCN